MSSSGHGPAASADDLSRAEGLVDSVRPGTEITVRHRLRVPIAYAVRECGG
jgi:hypothetical protein